MRFLAALIVAGLVAHTAPAADDEFPVYNPRTTVAGPRADKDFPIVDTPFIKVFDGGPSFWEIHYRVEKDDCDKFRVDLGY